MLRDCRPEVGRDIGRLPYLRRAGVRGTSDPGEANLAVSAPSRRRRGAPVRVVAERADMTQYDDVPAAYARRVVPRYVPIAQLVADRCAESLASAQLVVEVA